MVTFAESEGKGELTTMFKWLGKETELTNPTTDHDERACAEQHGDCACVSLPSTGEGADEGPQDDAEAPEEPYLVRTNPRAPAGFRATKGLDREFVIIGEAGMYVGTIVDVCADLAAGSYSGDTLINEVWRYVPDHQSPSGSFFEKVIMDTGWPTPGDSTQWPDNYGNVRVGLYTRTMIDATDEYRHPSGLRCLAWATFMIDGAA